MCYINALLTVYKSLFRRKGKMLLWIALILAWEAPLPASAQTQITPDNTLPTNVNNMGAEVYNITGGARPNNAINLFHSLSNFSVQSGDTARFVYDAGVANIITRITGGSVSNIDGRIQTLINGTNNTGNANLFLINPSGIIFGANAKLDIGGSFVASTADSLKFADGIEFSAKNPTANPLLTVSAPLGLQFGANANSTIRVQGSGNNLTLNNNALDRTNRPNGLSYQTPNGQTLALVGSNVVLDGGNVTVPQGNVELWSVNNGQVLFTNNNGQLQLQPGQGINYGNINLVNAASVDTSGIKGGNINARGRNIAVKDGSVLVTDTLGNGVGGVLNVQATELLQVSGIASSGEIFSALLADVAPGATGKGGDIFIDTKKLLVTDGGQISSGTFGNGDAGKLTVKAEDIQIIGISPLGANGEPLGPSGLFAPVAPGARGKGGNLVIETGSLRVLDGGQIFASTYGFGNAGEVRIKANNVEVSGLTPIGPSIISTSTIKLPIPQPFATFLGAGVGNGGNLLIETGNLRVANSGQISASTSGTGKAGNLEIIAKSVELTGATQFGRSGLFANAVRENGQGGDIKVSSDRLIVSDGATISVSNFLSRDPENLQGLAGKGAAGNIEINSSFVLLDNQGIITANTNAGDKGNITIQSQNLQMRRGSQISTNARNSSNGGNLRIRTNTLVALENSDITANAQQGLGGRVVINAKGIFGTEFRTQLTSASDITATSELGAEFNGEVQINTPEVDPSKGLAEMEQNPIDPNTQIANSCRAKDNAFAIIGRGGLPENPTQGLRNSTVWQDVRNLSAVARNANTIQTQSPTDRNEQKELVEAQGFMINAHGEVELVASVPKSVAINPWYNQVQCNSANTP